MTNLSPRTMLLLLVGLAGAPTLGAQEATEGFRPGDVVRLEVEGDTLFTGTFTVGPGPALTLPVIGEIPLAGVRRVALETHLQQQLGRYLRNPVIRAKALIRLSILGEVAKPGIYAVPTDLVLADAVMVAGGPTQDAKFAATRIERGSQRLLEGDRLQQALARGLTVDDLNLRAGDQIFVPHEARRDPESKWRVLGILLTIPVAIFTIRELSK
jgi:polysaccharide export outer membrane protein